MNKRLALVSIGLTVSVFMIGAAACDSEEGSNFPPNNEADATFDQGGFNTDGNNTSKDVVGPVNCTPSLPTNFKGAWKAPTKTAACPDDEIAGYFDSCLGNVKIPDAGAACKGWKDSHATCAQCIETADNNGPIQFYRERLYFTLNVAGCLSILRSETADGTCSATYDDSIQCQRASCNDCLLNTGANFPDFTACQGKAKASACSAYEAKRDQACGSTYNDPDGGAWDCFSHPGDDQKTHFMRVEKIFCGQ